MRQHTPEHAEVGVAKREGEGGREGERRGGGGREGERWRGREIHREIYTPQTTTVG